MELLRSVRSVQGRGARWTASQTPVARWTVEQLDPDAAQPVTPGDSVGFAATVVNVADTAGRADFPVSVNGEARGDQTATASIGQRDFISFSITVPEAETATVCLADECVELDTTLAPAPEPEIPPAPAGGWNLRPAFAGAGRTSVELTWNGNIGPSVYEVEERTTGRVQTFNRTRGVFAGLEPGTTYRFRVRSTAGETPAGEFLASEWSETISVTTEGGESEPEPEPEPEPDIRLLELDAPAGPHPPGDSISLTVTAENRGDAVGTITEDVTVNGALAETVSLTVPPDSTASTTTSLTVPAADRMVIEVDVLDEIFDIEAPQPEPEPEPEPQPEPEIAVTGLDAPAGPHAPDDTITASITAENTGGADGSRSVSVFVNEALVQTVTLGVGAGETVTQNVSLTVPEAPDMEIEVAGEQETLQIEIPDPQPPGAPEPADMAITSIDAPSGPFESGAAVPVTFTVENTGDLQGLLDSPIAVNDEPAGTVSTTVPPGERASTTVELTAPDAPEMQIDAGGQRELVQIEPPGPPEPPEPGPGPGNGDGDGEGPGLGAGFSTRDVAIVGGGALLAAIVLRLLL